MRTTAADPGGSSLSSPHTPHTLAALRARERRFTPPYWTHSRRQGHTPCFAGNIAKGPFRAVSACWPG